jgi:hypothetical protein
MLKNIFCILMIVSTVFAASCAQSNRNQGASSSESAPPKPENKDKTDKKTDESKAESKNTPEKTDNDSEKTDKKPVDSAVKTETKTADGFENRCGWYSNPTPANHWLDDRDGEWIVGVQGGHQAEGDFPDFEGKEWVKTNGYYGYGCACLVMKADPKTREVLEIKSYKVLPLATCRKDPKLKEPKE